MTEHVFRAADSDTAMEKAIRELGDDAMILSVKRVGDTTEVRAMKDTAAPRRIRKQTTVVKSAGAQQIDLATAMRQARSRREEPIEPAPINIFLDESDDAPDQLGGDTPAEAEFRAAEPVVPAPRQPRPAVVVKPTPEAAAQVQPKVLPPSRVAPKSIKPVLATKPAPVITAPPSTDKKPLVLKPFNPNANVPDSEIEAETDKNTKPVLRPYVPRSQGGVRVNPPIQTVENHVLAQNGFPADIVTACIDPSDPGDLTGQLRRASDLLAERLAVASSAPSPLESDIVFVFGPPGSGKTTTAAKIAFHRIQTSQSRPSMLSLSKSGLFTDDRLRRHASFLNTPYADTLSGAELPLIVDCDHTDPIQIRQALAAVQDNFPSTRVQAIMTIPGAWSANAINKFTRDMALPDLGAIITHMQIDGVSIQGLSTLSANEVSVISTMNDAAVSDGASLTNAPSLAALMREAFNNRESDA